MQENANFEKDCFARSIVFYDNIISELILAAICSRSLAQSFVITIHPGFVDATSSKATKRQAWGHQKQSNLSKFSERCEEEYHAFTFGVLDSSSTAQLATSTFDDVSSIVAISPIGNSFNLTGSLAVQRWLLSALTGCKMGRVS